MGDQRAISVAQLSDGDSRGDRKRIARHREVLQECRGETLVLYLKKKKRKYGGNNLTRFILGCSPVSTQLIDEIVEYEIWQI